MKFAIDSYMTMPLPGPAADVLFARRTPVTLRRASSLLRAILTGKRVSAEVCAAREAICATCDQVRKDEAGALWCSRCGCGVSRADAQIKNLAAYVENLPRWGCKHPDRAYGKGWPKIDLTPINE